ncbi:zinc finger protein with KRAB and SCAN domains 5-like isoform X1 [Phlebotomus papatasi]|uniref:zinc finger protein with KRAB and SCAN domains 5-like isoform X1 n=2 Tax=Phlebotomus papatasi TaxID=29031 RepID=UPI0024846E22|nr:zinc finger protein with KRAB and SCAN domains 5-like isoform X1 [Phlebotomus papatasi]
MEMDDNDNFLDYQKMNFSPFTTQFASAIPANAVNQFTAAKFTQNITTANGQVVGLVSGGDGGVHYLRPVESGAAFPGQTQTTTTSNSLQQTHQTLITLPITMPGAKPGDAQQTVQIQVVNPNPIQQQPKFQMGQMQIPIQGLQQGTTVLTVAYAPQEGDILQNHGLPEGMTVVAALQPQDLQLIAQAQAAMSSQAQQQQQQQQQNTQQTTASQTTEQSSKEEEAVVKPIQIKQEPVWQNSVSTPSASTDISDYLSRIPTQELPLHLHHFLKFNAETIKRESQVENSPLNGALITYDYGGQQQQQQVEGQVQQQESHSQDASVGTDIQGDIPAGEGGEKAKKKRRYKKKPPKPKRPKPGQVHIATALDGTILFCCPECHRAYPEKENLEQHLSVHKIERRFICDICGAGLKRKEHLERHKLGHNPDRPYICSVCMKGFKRKEHLNLHFVIHSGEKTEICGECGKGFYRKDHLRKHAKSHAMKRMKEELSAQASAAAAAAAAAASSAVTSIATSAAGVPAVSITAIPTVSGSNSQQSQEANGEPEMNSGMDTTSIQTSVATPVTSATNTTIIHVPTSNNTTLPVQIQLPQLVATTTAESSSANVVLPPTSDSLM